MLRAWWVGVASVVVAVGIACSSSDDSSSSGGTSGTGAASGYQQCPPANTPSTCTAADLNSYENCFASKCDAQFKQCFGADYKSGTFAGACGPFEACSQKCACGDSVCTAKCGTIPPACSQCQAGFASCSQTCTLPACYATGTSTSSGGGSTSSSSSSSGSSGPHTCAQLATCCAKVPAGDEQDSCNNIAQSGLDGGTDTSCNIAYDTFSEQATGGCN